MRDRAGRTLDPLIVEKFCKGAAQFLAMPSVVREEVLAAEPGPCLSLNDEEMETAGRALADFADLQTPFSTGTPLPSLCWPKLQLANAVSQKQK
jgi:hypothetical protein